MTDSTDDAEDRPHIKAVLDRWDRYDGLKQKEIKMGKRVIITPPRTFVKTPVVRLTEVVESTFIGKMLGSRETKYGLAFDMTVVDGDAPIKIRNEAKEWVNVDVRTGDKVNVLSSAGGQLEQKLKQTAVGETVEIIFNGKVLNPKSGREYNEFTVSVID